MSVALVALAAAILLYLHTRSLGTQRQTFEDRLDAQAQRHAMDLRKLMEAADRERLEWHRTLNQDRTQLLEQITAERVTAADERVQLLNRIKPDTYHPPLSAPEAVSGPPAVGFEDDEGFWKAAESRDELVERVERELQAARAS